jgi:3D (Asp-Asp-Asp) domain-containing protein
MKRNLFIAILIIFGIILIPKTTKVNTSVDTEITKIDDEVAEEFKRIVTLTTYTVDASQTDSTPLITASGYKLDSVNPRRHRIIAISRDLKRKFGFGEKVILENAGKYNGVWYVHDLMNRRFRNKVDILINPDGRHTKKYGVIIKKFD